MKVKIVLSYDELQRLAHDVVDWLMVQKPLKVGELEIILEMHPTVEGNLRGSTP